jgi:hypothetical protein
LDVIIYLSITVIIQPITLFDSARFRRENREARWTINGATIDSREGPTTPLDLSFTRRVRLCLFID